MHQKIKVVLEVEGKYYQQQGNGILYKQKDLTIDGLAFSGLIEAHATDWILQPVAYIKNERSQQRQHNQQTPRQYPVKKVPGTDSPNRWVT